MTRESAHVAALRVALGKGLAYHREQNRITQLDLAEQLYYDRTSIAKIETGQQGAPEAFWREADELLDAGGELVAGFDALSTVKASRNQPNTQAAPRRGTPADVLTDMLAAAVVPVAQATNRVRSTSALPDQVDVVIDLEALSRALSQHSRRVLMGEPADWAEITERLRSATAACQRHITIEVCTQGIAARETV